MRTLLVINATCESAADEAIAKGERPRQDYRELQRRTAADMIDLGALTGWFGLLSRVTGASIAQAILAWARAARYDAVFVDRESTGSVLAALCRLRRHRPRVVMIGHLLTSPKKRAIFRLLGVRHSVDCVIVHSSVQQRAAIEQLGMRPDQVALVPYQTDGHFWQPRGTTPRRQICSAGLEYRDYATLLEAVRDLEVEVIVAAASHWSKHRIGTGTERLPANVRMVSLDYAALRELYAESLFVVVPLREGENQAGITTILEAMAMGKAVVVSHTMGQSDVVRDRRRMSRADPNRPTQPDWARSLGATTQTSRGQTGIYVRPGDPGELCRAIDFLLTHPEEARVMGANGRRLIDEAMGLDHFVDRLAGVIYQETLATFASSADGAAGTS